MNTFLRRFFGVILLTVLFALSSPAKAEPKLFWVEGDQVTSKIITSKIDGSEPQVVMNSAVSGTFPFFISIDDTNNKIYWSSISPVGIYRANLDGSGIEVVYDASGDMPMPYFIATDPINQQVFWVDFTANGVNRSLRKVRFDKTGIESKNFTHFSIAAAPTFGFLLYGDSQNGGIFRRDIKDIQANAASVVAQPPPIEAMTVLHTAGQVLWFSSTSSAIKKSSITNPAASNLAVLAAANNVVVSLAADRLEQNLYWTDSKQSAIMRMSLSDPNPNAPTITKITGTTNPFGLAISCGTFAPDADGDGSKDCEDLCPQDPLKSTVGVCGCNVDESNVDSDADGVADCIDQCPNDIRKTEPGICGCGMFENSKSNGDVSCDLLPNLTKDTVLTLPPVTVVTNRSVKIRVQKFLKAVFRKKKSTERRSISRARLTLAAKTPKLSVRYAVNVKRENKSVADLLSKRNEITFKNLKPGNYTVNYRAQIFSDGKSVSKTNRSPTAQFIIN